MESTKIMKKKGAGKAQQRRVTEQPKGQGAKGSGKGRRSEPVIDVTRDKGPASDSPSNPPAVPVSGDEQRNLAGYVEAWDRLSSTSFENDYGRGRLLVQAKAGLARGEWLDFLAHARRVSNRHAQRWMRVVLQFDPELSSNATSMSHLAAVGMTRLHAVSTLSADRWRFSADGELQVLDGHEWIAVSERSTARIRVLKSGRDALSVKQVDNLLEQWDRLVPDTEERELWLSGNLEKLPAVSRWSEEARKEIDRLALRLKKAEEFLAQVTQASRECPPADTTAPDTFSAAEPSKPDDTSPAEQDGQSLPNPAEAA